MALYYDIFNVREVALCHERYIRCAELATQEDRLRRRRGLPPVNEEVLAKLKAGHDQFQRSLRDVALATSLRARQEIVSVFRKTHKRDDTGVSPHLQDNIVCRALAPFGSFQTGAVGIADEALLERTPYWRYQEEGTTGNVGRVIRGYFYGTGYKGQPTPPQPGIDTQPLFKPGPPLTGQKLPFGIGVIQRPVQPRHFLRDGTAEARVQWRAEIAALQAQQISFISALAP